MHLSIQFFLSDTTLLKGSLSVVQGILLSYRFGFADGSKDAGFRAVNNIEVRAMQIESLEQKSQGQKRKEGRDRWSCLKTRTG